MKSIRHIALAGVGMLGACASAQEATPPAAPASAPAPEVTAAKPAAKDANEVRIQYDHQIEKRIFSAYYSNLSQARVKVSALKRFDAVQAKPREYFIAEISGAGLTDNIVFDVDDDASRLALLNILERFKSEATKTGELMKRMRERKAAAEKELSKAETELVVLTEKADTAPEVIAKTKAQIAKWTDEINVAEELAKMKKISGEMGKARIHMEHPEYAFVGSFEPGSKQLYVLRAGFGLQISFQDVDYYIDLLKRTPEFRQRLLDGEAKEKRLQEEIRELFKQR